jgi:hypothetical protein
LLALARNGTDGAKRARTSARVVDPPAQSRRCRRSSALLRNKVLMNRRVSIPLDQIIYWMLFRMKKRANVTAWRMNSTSECSCARTIHVERNFERKGRSGTT